MNVQSIPLYIFLSPFISAIFIPFFYKKKYAAHFIAALGLVGSAYFSLQGLANVQNGEIIHHFLGGWTPPFGIEWRMDAFSAVMTSMVSILALVVIMATRPTVESEIHHSRLSYYVIVLLHVAALMGMILTRDLFNLFVFLEVSSLTGYALIATGDSQRGNVSSLRYLFIGTIGASFYLLGVGYLYAATGTLNMGDLAARLPEVAASRTVLIGIILILIGLLIKIGLFPFHGWLPDAYTYASNSASALIAPLMTKVSIYAFVRIFFGVFGFFALRELHLSTILIALASIAVIAGAVMAFVQTQFKRMLAYSSISHIGLILLGFALDNPTAFMGSVLHILNHALMKAILFIIAAAAFDQYGVKDIYDFSRFRGKMPYTLAAFSVAALSMIGVPPLCGFFSKWYIVVGAFEAGQFWVAGLILFSSLLTALYFFRVIEQAFFQQHSPARKQEEAKPPMVVSAVLLSVTLFVMGWFAPSIFRWGITYLYPIGS